jgi:hypothetical protein
MIASRERITCVEDARLPRVLTLSGAAWDADPMEAGASRAWWTAFRARVLETAHSFPPSLKGTLTIEVWDEHGGFAYYGLGVDGHRVEMAEGRVPKDTACLSIRADVLPALLRRGAPPPGIDLYGDAQFVTALLEAMSSAPKAKSWLELRVSK